MKDQTNCKNCIHSNICKFMQTSSEECEFFAEKESKSDTAKLGTWKQATAFSLMFVCSECGRDGCFIRKPYCPYCGAKMNLN